MLLSIMPRLFHHLPMWGPRSGLVTKARFLVDRPPRMVRSTGRSTDGGDEQPGMPRVRPDRVAVCCAAKRPGAGGRREPASHARGAPRSGRVVLRREAPRCGRPALTL